MISNEGCLRRPQPLLTDAAPPPLGGAATDSAAARFIVPLLVSAAAVMYAAIVAPSMDIPVADEAVYIARGLRREALNVTSKGFLYSLWYFLLSHLEPDPRRLYDLNVRILFPAATLLLYFMLRGLGLPLAGALFASLAAYWTIGVSDTKIHLFTLIVILAAFNIAVRAGSPLGFFSSLSIGAAAVTYCRQEFICSFILLAPLWIHRWLLHLRYSPYSRTSVIHLLLLGGVLSALVLAYPGSGPKQLSAFSTGYARGKLERKGVSDDPHYYARRFLRDDFGTPNTLVEAIMTNPRAFAAHVTHNVYCYLRALRQNPVTPSRSRTDPRPWGKILSSAEWLFLLSLSLLLARRLMDRGRLFSAKQQQLLWAIAAFSAPGLISILVCMVFWRYLMISNVLLAALAIYLAFALWPFKLLSNRHKRARLILSAACVVTISLALARNDHFRFTGQKNALATRRTVEAIRGLHLSGPVRVASGDRTTLYLPATFIHQDVSANPVKTSDADMIIVNAAFRSRAREVTLLPIFLENPAVYGFRKIPVPATGNFLLVKEALLNNHGTTSISSR